MRMHDVAAIGALVISAALANGCSATVTTTPATVVETTPTNCFTDDSIGCSVGDGWRCPIGDNPEAEATTQNLSCSVPESDPDGTDDDFCCIVWSSTSTTCTPDDELTAECQYPSLGYQCDQGDNPITLDSSLNCSVDVTDPNDSTKSDFCCE